MASDYTIEIMLTVYVISRMKVVRKRSLSRRLAIVSLFQGLTRPKSVKRLKTFGIVCVRSSLRLKSDLMNKGSALKTAESLKMNC